MTDSKKSDQAATLLGAAVVIGVAIWFFGFRDSAPAQTTGSGTVAAHVYKPEEYVVFQSDGFACESRDTLHEAITHSVMGEKTLFKAMFDDGRCGQLPSSIPFRVLHAELTMLEVRPDTNPDPHGVWTAPEFVQPATTDPHLSNVANDSK